MAASPPPLTTAQRSAASRAALAARRERAAVKQQVRSGYLSCSQVIDLAFQDTPQGRAVARMTIGDLLLSLPGVGATTADRHLIALGIRGDRRLRALGEHQRAGLRRVFW